MLRYNALKVYLNWCGWVLSKYTFNMIVECKHVFHFCISQTVLNISFPIEWKTANVIPLPKRNPPVSIEKDIRPISLTPIAAKVFESIVMKWIDEKMDGKIDNKQFGGISGTSTTDVLLEMVNKWYEATDNLDSYVRVVMLDFSKGFDLINHCLLIEK